MIALSKTSVLITAVLTVVLIQFVANLASAGKTTPSPIDCVKTSDCGPPSTHQDCVNGKCGCIIGYDWFNGTFTCIVQNCKNTADCKAWPHSVCSNSTCVCDKKFHVDKPTQTCKHNSAQSTQSVLMLVVIAFGASFLLHLF